jgi:hypothetical protein
MLTAVTDNFLPKAGKDSLAVLCQWNVASTGLRSSRYTWEQFIRILCSFGGLAVGSSARNEGISYVLS